MDVCPAADQVVTLLPQESPVSQLSSVQLSPNRVREDIDFDTGVSGIPEIRRLFPS